MRHLTRLLPLFLCARLPAQTPYAFLPNLGQWPDAVHGMVQHGAQSTWLTRTGFTTQVAVAAAPSDPRGADGPDAPLPSAKTAVVDVEFVGAADARPVFTERLPGVVGFFVGNDASRWAPSVPRFGACERKDLWPGVDLRFATRGGALAYDLHVAPGAGAGSIQMRIAGPRRMRVGEDGALELDVGFGTLRHGRPVAWQEGAGGTREPLVASFVLADDDRLSFVVEGRDSSRPLVIDPPILWTSLLGGGGNDGVGFRQTMDRDANGNVVVCGYTNSGQFPGGPVRGTWDGFLTAYDRRGTLVWSTVIGGANPAEEFLRACRWDGRGGVVFGGYSSAADFPTVGALQATNNGPLGPGQYGDMVAGRLVPTASGLTLVWSTFLGGPGAELVNGIAALSGGRVAVTGWSNSSGMPVHAGAAQPNLAGGYDGYTAILDPSFIGRPQCTHGTWWGGGLDEVPGCIVEDPAGRLVVGGYTPSADFPTTSNALQRSYQGGAADGYVTCFDPTLSVALYSSYLGGPDGDQANDLAVDRAGRWVIANWTGAGFNLPISFAASAFQPLPVGLGDGYALILDPWQPPAQQVVWGTYLGGNLTDGVNGVAVDSAGRVTVVGAVETLRGTTATTYPTTSWSLQRTPPGGPGGNVGHFDAFVARFDPRRSGPDQLVYPTFLGGTGFDYGYDVVLDERDRPIVIGPTSSSTFPPGMPRPGGSQDIFISHLDLLASVVADRFGNPSPACSHAHLDAYHQQLTGGFDLTLTCADAPPSSVGWLLLGFPDAAGTPVPPLGLVSHVSFTGPLILLATIATDATGYASCRLQAGLTPPVWFAVQAFWLGGCAGFVASDAIRL